MYTATKPLPLGLSLTHLRVEGQVPAVGRVGVHRRAREDHDMPAALAALGEGAVQGDGMLTRLDVPVEARPGGAKAHLLFQPQQGRGPAGVGLEGEGAHGVAPGVRGRGVGAVVRPTVGSRRVCGAEVLVEEGQRRGQRVAVRFVELAHLYPDIRSHVDVHVQAAARLKQLERTHHVGARRGRCD